MNRSITKEQFFASRDAWKRYLADGKHKKVPVPQITRFYENGKYKQETVGHHMKSPLKSYHHVFYHYICGKPITHGWNPLSEKNTRNMPRNNPYYNLYLCLYMFNPYNHYIKKEFREIFGDIFSDEDYSKLFEEISRHLYETNLPLAA